MQSRLTVLLDRTYTYTSVLYVPCSPHVGTRVQNSTNFHTRNCYLAVSVPRGGLTSLPCGNPLRPGGLGFLSVRLCARLLMSLFQAAVDQRYSHWANNNLG